MLLLIPTWLALFLICLGHGGLVYCLVFRFAGRPFRVAPSAFQLFWIGFALLIGFIELSSLVRPVDGVTLALACVIGCAGLPAAAPVVGRAFHAARRHGLIAAATRLVLAVVVACFVAYNASKGLTWYDTVSTHLQQVRWAQTYGSVPGLANLNPKLGFDQAHHLLAAMVDNLVWQRRSFHVVLGFLTTTTLIQWLFVLTLPAKREADARGKVFAALTLPYLAGKAMSDEVVSLSGDLAMGLLLLVGVLELVRLPMRDWRRAPRRATFGLFVVAALGAAVFAVKFSALPFVVAAFGLPAWGVLRGWYPRRMWVLASLCVVPMLVVGGVIARRIVLTGWPLFPIPVGRLPCSWSVPADTTLEHYLWIKSWARLPRVDYHEVLDHGYQRWFPAWYDGFRGSHELTLLVVGLSALAVWGTSRTLRARVLRGPGIAAALTVAILSLAYWFVGAPDLRFGSVFFWLLLGVTVAPVLALEYGSVTSRMMVFGVAAYLVSWNGGLDFRLSNEVGWFDVPLVPVQLTTPLLIEAPDGSSLVVNVPIGYDLCGEAPLPCTPDPRKQRLRRPGRLASGFLP